MFNPLVHPCRRRPRQDASVAGHHLGGKRRRRAQGALPHRREVHVRLRLGAAHADGARLQGSAARHRRAGDRRPAVPARQVDAGRVLPHAQRADRRRPAGGDRLRPSAVGPGEPRRPGALAAGRRAGGGDGPARRGTALRDPESAGDGGAHPPSGLRRAGAGPELHRQDRDPQRPRSGRRAQPPARPQQADRPRGDAGNGRARGARPDPPAGAEAGQDRGHPAGGGAAIQRQPLRPACPRAAPPMWCARARWRCIWPRR